MCRRNSRCINDQCCFRIQKVFWNGRYIFLIMNGSSFSNQFFGQFAWRTVVTTYFLAFRQEIANQCTHADTSGTDEVYCFQYINVHDFLYI